MLMASACEYRMAEPLTRRLDMHSLRRLLHVIALWSVLSGCQQYERLTVQVRDNTSLAPLSGAKVSTFYPNRSRYILFNNPPCVSTAITGADGTAEVLIAIGEVRALLIWAEDYPEHFILMLRPEMRQDAGKWWKALRWRNRHERSTVEVRISYPSPNRAGIWIGPCPRTPGW